MKKILIVALFLTFSTPFFASAAGGFSQPNGQSCIDGTDCVSGYCNSNNICASNSQASSPSPSGNTSDGFTALAPIPGLTDTSATSVISSTSLANFFNNLYKYLIGLAAVLAVIEIIWGGIEISTKDSVSKQSDGRERITQAILGLILVLSPVLVFSIINPSILNLSLNLPPIGLNTPPYTAAGGSIAANQAAADPGTVAATAAGCVVTGTLLKTAVCPTEKAAQDFATACDTGSGNVPFFTTVHKATCSTEKGPITGPYSFADVSQSTGIIGFVNTWITGYSKYEPLASTPTNPNNGSSVLQFASACTADGGTTCMSSTKLPCTSSLVNLLTGGPSVSCWDISLSCTDGASGAGGCSDNPKFTVVTSK
ncbi:MAG: hypothetical protein ACYC1Y_03095 [Minisyncoccota bacterium]